MRPLALATLFVAWSFATQAAAQPGIPLVNTLSRAERADILVAIDTLSLKRLEAAQGRVGSADLSDGARQQRVIDSLDHSIVDSLGPVGSCLLGSRTRERAGALGDIACSGGALVGYGFTNGRYTEHYFGQTSSANLVGFNASEGSANAYAELVAGLVRFPWAGYGRFSLSGLVSSQDSSGAPEAQFFDQGGSVSANMLFPLYYRLASTRSADQTFHIDRRFDLLWSLTVSGDLPVANESVEVESASVKVGPALFASTTAFDRAFRLYAVAHTGYAHGLDSFYENLGESSSTIVDQGFLFVQYEAGIEVSDRIRIGLAGGTSSSRKLQSPLRISTTLLNVSGE